MKKLVGRAADVHEKFSFCGEKAKKWIRECELLLPEVEKLRIWEQLGFSCIYEYAAKVAGMSRRKVVDVLWVLKKVEDKPELIKVAEKKGVNAIRPAATIATVEDQGFWAEKAENMSHHTFRTFVKETRKESRDVPNAEYKSVTMQLCLDLAEKLEKLAANSDYNDLIEEYLQLREEKLEREKPETKRSKSKYVPIAIQKYSHKTTNGTCCVPGCTHKSVVLHHSDRFALKKEHNPDKIHPLCKEHHQLVHLGLIENEGKDPKYWCVRRKREKYDIKNMIDDMVVAKMIGGG
ncbi:MAG: hypothetical protein GWP15_01740 [Nitrospirae bacterium]|nr:hypothetical protein [Nitrospirota bacterium]